METPSSTRRITRSQALAASNNIPTSSKKIEDSEKGPASKSRNRTGSQQDRSALIDITNDSPIIGLAMGKFKTPSSSSTLSKKRVNNDHQQAKTPGSGEALLRGQVKTLLQRVEEEAEISKLLSENRPSLLHLLSPAGLLAPANTPQVTASEVQEQIMISEMITQIFDGKKKEGPESEKSLITRSLLLDFSEKSESSDSSGCSSVLTHEGGIGGESTESKEKSSSMEEDDDSIWSIQVNASTKDEEEEEEENDEDDYDYGEEAEEEDHDDEYDEGLVDELCEGMSKISVYGRHTRFVYNSDDEIEGEEDCDIFSSGVLKLKGMPTPKGKHLRFPEESEEEEEEIDD